MLRQGDCAFMKHENGTKELYNLSNDPYQERNVIHRANLDFVASVASKLNAMKTAQGDVLRALEVA
jgi:hypothetical protein